MRVLAVNGRDTQITRESCKWDPIAKTFLKISEDASWPIALLSLLLNILIMVVPGLFVSLQIENQGLPFVSMLSRSDIGFALFTYLVYSPVVWLFYTWQSREIGKVMEKLQINNVTALPDKSPSMPHNLAGPWWQRTITRIFVANGLMAEVLIIISTFAAAFVYILVFLPNGPFYNGLVKESYYFQVNDLYFVVLFLPFLFLNVYMMLWIMARQIRMLWLLADLLGRHIVEPQLYFPDGCNGFSPIGKYAAKFSYFSFLFGVWLLLVTANPQFIGQPANLGGHILLILAGYALGVLILQLPLVVIAHNAMAAEKAAKLRVIATKLQQYYSLEQMQHEQELLHGKEYVQELERRYQILEKEYRTWPFRAGFFAVYGAELLLPVATTVLAVLFK